MPNDPVTPESPLAAETVAVLGIPWDEHSSFMRGPAQAPPRIREALQCGSANWCAENGLDLSQDPRFTDQGDLDLTNNGDPAGQIEYAVHELLRQRTRLIVLGGDHTVTLPVVRAYARHYAGLNILHLDAHPDLYDQLDGDRNSHACPFARIMEAGLAARLVQIGIRTLNPHQRRQARRFGVEIVEMKDWPCAWEHLLQGPLYLSVDMDVLDPAFAPGVSHHEPGGLSTREVLKIIQHLPGPVVGADIVEFNPRRDPVGITAMTAAKLLKEIAAAMLAGDDSLAPSNGR